MKVRLLAVVAALGLIAAGCGARLTKAQLEALNTSGNGTGVNVGQSPGAATGPSGGTSGGSSPISGRSSTAVRGTPGSRGSTRGAVSGGTKSGGAGGGPVIQAGNPLAGPGGKVCPVGAPGSGPGVTAKTITVGNIATINGPVPSLFTGARYGTEAVADYINSLGGLCGRQITVNSADDQFDQATDQNEAQSMSNSTLAFVGSFSLQDPGIPAGAPNEPDIGESLSSQRFQSPMNFSPQPNAPGYNTGSYLYFLHDGNPGDSKSVAYATQHMALLVENTPQTATTGKWMESALKSVGYKFVFTDTNLQPTDPTFDGDVPRMKAAGVTGVVFQATGAIIGQLANSMYQDGMNVVLGNYCAAAYDPAYISQAGAGVQGTLLSQSLALYDGQDASSIPMVATFDQWYSRVNPGASPDIYAAYGWMSGLLFAEGLNAGGSATRAALLTGLKQITSFTGGGLAPAANPVSKTPPSCWLLIDVKSNRFVRDPETPAGFKCSPSGYYHA